MRDANQTQTLIQPHFIYKRKVLTGFLSSNIVVYS